MPPARMRSAAPMKPGRWLVSQVGVKAPGTPKRTTRPRPRSSAVSTSDVPSAVTYFTGTDGSLSPAWIIVRDFRLLLETSGLARGDHLRDRVRAIGRLE